MPAVRIRPSTDRQRGRRLRGLALATGLVTALLAGSSGTATAAEPSATISSGELGVTVSTDFPQVVGYRHTASGEVLHGRTAPLRTVRLNGTDHTPRVTAAASGDRVAYTLEFPTAGGTELDAVISVSGHVVTFAVTAVRDSDAYRVNTIAIPDHDLVSVRSTDPKPQVAAAKVDLSVNRTGDTIYPVTAETPADAAPVNSTYVIVSTGRLAAGLETNSVYDRPDTTTRNDTAHFWRQARQAGGYTEVGVWSGQWTYRGETAPAGMTEPLPRTQISITPERNGDGATDWQDGALALREIAYTPKGAEHTADRVVQRIPFNIASAATHPFLKTLDDTKRIHLATDGLGQLVLLKGYQSEGHDAAHPDYGGHYNERAGGLRDLNTLLAAGDRYAADFGVHVNVTESYPEAYAFSETLVDKNNPQWAWMDQSYRINQRRDLASGDVLRRFQTLYDETGGNLDALYIDVFRESGWTADGLTRRLRDMGYEITTEWSHRLVRDALWTHWSADYDYGGEDFKGINSKIMRFVDNHRRDVYIPHPLLGSAQIVESEGWTGEVDHTAFLHNVWGTNLPVKYLQHFPIQRWSDSEIGLADGVRVRSANGTRQIFSGETKVLDGDAYLLPWDPKRPDRLYHYNAKGGKSTWTVPAPFAGASSLRLYRLDDQGRHALGTVPVTGGKVTLDAAAKTAYVLYGSDPAAAKDPKYGEGTPLSDPGFSYGDLRAWDGTGAVVERNGRGQYEAVVRGAGEASLSQPLRDLSPGTYAASAMIEVEPGKTRPTTLTVTPSGGAPQTVRIDRSTIRNTVASSEKHSTHSQRVRVFFDVPQGADSATLELKVGAGRGVVRLDDVQVTRSVKSTDSWDFEHVDQGWGPFYRGDDANLGDATTHLSERHGPYTQKGWNGKLVDDVIGGDWSLKSYEYASQLCYRTAPYTVRFTPGHRYRVSFDYQSAKAGAYGWVLGVDGTGGNRELKVTALGAAQSTTRYAQEFTAGTDGDYWVGLRRMNTDGDQHEFALDNFRVEDLGPA